MGLFHSLPLPDRIPCPNNETLHKMEDIGFKILKDDYIVVRDISYVKYTMPYGWSLENDTMTNLHHYYFVDEHGFARVEIRGFWEMNLFDGIQKKLWISIVHNPHKFKPYRSFINDLNRNREH
ncbi:MAG: hypothetical protein Satyrvirus36_6 [Satyrvirus sp.]|uniref:Uncharacterized protein n=1 Tax=Satyrvirus sp. TaxID=2487771 RepID=A0A3G5AF39_9VIRU|nr:MAG: hypothetical protein Satyrvirus36_6 [Satyrvirus sp.]